MVFNTSRLKILNKLSCINFTLLKCKKEETSDAYVLEDFFPSLSSKDVFSWFENPYRTIANATDMAYNEMVVKLLAKSGKENRKLNARIGQRFNKYYYSVGSYVEIEAPRDRFSMVTINNIVVNVEYTGKINIVFENELAVKDIVEVDVVNGETTIKTINKAYKYVKIYFEDKDIKGREVIGCSALNGIMIDYSMGCDFHEFICQNKDLFVNAMAYKVASIIITEGQFSGEYNQRMMQAEDYAELKAEYETQFNLQIRSLSLVESGCFNCCNKISFPVNLP